ncbi:MAG: ABC transporter substrate-binding protein, partial [Armatimonadota bacterium]
MSSKKQGLRWTRMIRWIRSSGVCSPETALREKSARLTVSAIHCCSTVIIFRALLMIPLAVLLSSCAQVPDGSKRPGTYGFHAGLDARESPMLAALVNEGKLPPLKDRLPADPMVVKPYERPGVYGGTWRMIHDSPDFADLKITLWYAPLIRWKQDSSGVDPGLAKSWGYSDGGRTLTLHLRTGLKWSDGAPYTSEDFKFYYDLCTNGRLKLAPPGWCIVKGRPMKVETPNPLTIVMRFAGLNYFAHLQLATGFWSPEEYSIPKHYMKQFHPDYNRNYKDFVVFEQKNITHLNPDRPTMCSWRLKGIESGGSRVIFERNPYCPMVDTLGRQLPYIDRIESTLVADPQLRLLRMLAGEVDCQWRAIDLSDLGLFTRGQKRGGYRIKLWNEGCGAMSAVLINWDQPDPILRRIVRDKRFRRALAHAVPREKINLVIYRGMAEPQNSVISAQSWHFTTL